VILSNQSAVYLPGSSNYINDISHWSTAINQTAACSVEPGTPQDISTILLLLGAGRIPFAIKSGGHSPNPGFSSTTGVQISMARFNSVNYNSNRGTVEVGSGLIWDDVYKTLDPLGVTVTGGRVQGVGVGGLTLGGGYSWKANQYGLGIDNVVSFEMVTPRGQVLTVTNTSNPDLFFALRGGGNNFGIVTKFTFIARPQTQIFGGVAQYSDAQAQAIIQATVNFQEKNDPKAQVIVIFGSSGGIDFGVLILFYDAPTPANGIFDEFLAIPTLPVPGTGYKTQALNTFVSSVAGPPGRQLFSTVPIIKYTRPVLNCIYNESKYWGSQIAQYPGAVVTWATEPFLPNLFSTSKGGAYPHTVSNPVTPMNIDFAWQSTGSNPSQQAQIDQFFKNGIIQSTNKIFQCTLADGQNIGGNNKILYSNYALPGTPLQELYGNNLARLKRIRATYDPLKVMNLAGGFKI
jgi:UDP-N-acetylenolpyruvoylglucosamine reductase